MLKVAKQAAKSAGDIILENFKTEINFQKKADKTFVSEVDLKAEKEIKRIIRKSFPDHKIIGEEFGLSEGNNFIWHIDPLDGTHNFKNGLLYSCTSIGVERDGEFILGVIYNPNTDEMFWAEKGQGAFVNGERLFVNKESLLDGLVFLDGSMKGERAKRKIKLQKKLINVAPNIRIMGSTALQMTEVARGNAVLTISDAIHSYDFAAGVVLVKEAGGVVCDQYGEEIRPKSKVVAAVNNKKNHKEIVSMTKKSYKGYKGMK